jgi:protein-S-isoprenylcysteine O-methyltransferase Ste14
VHAYALLMSRHGVGPKWTLLSLLFAAPAIGVRLGYPELVHIPWLPRWLVVALGVALLAVGIPLCVLAIVTLARDFEAGKLFTRGAYGLCRHPIYGSWVVFNVPGLVLLADCWVGLLVPIPMYLALRWLVRAEEDWLERTFGNEYHAYRARVPAVFPLPRALQRRAP